VWFVDAFGYVDDVVIVVGVCLYMVWGCVVGDVLGTVCVGFALMMV